ncbi:ectonucleotide pyrophosphatase/phosphodiesterase family member 6-like isoform X1 [Limulus polyphemus]|uniref:glycerophosphocholine cholinephosphodiesterase n=1 Tax=Limulus polyphemus TaxID=6850 RepID=A0ABM1BK00_LIMPO|nr:ectonucleotide pyrophosphatase/phosphodiesterase family member 6-like isoform X1 [Limulus polyphemus]
MFRPFLLLVAFMFVYCSSVVNRQKVLLILVDGCRWDYPDEEKGLTGFRRMAENGVRAKYVTPIFPSNSYPNWYTIVTGLYAENHGFVQNYLYDPDKGDFFLMAPDPSASVAHWWKQAEPLWITAKKNKLKSALYWWDGCQVEIRGEKPNECIQYKSLSEWYSLDEDVLNKLNETLEKFQNHELDLVQLYYEPVDGNGHMYGPDSNERKVSFARIDRILDSLQTELEKRNMKDEVNLVIVSDHGMTSTDPTKGLKVINISDTIDLQDLKFMIYSGASSMIIPTEGQEDKVYEALMKTKIDGLHVYKKEDIPEEYHIKHNRLTTPIILIADYGYYIAGLGDPVKSKPNSTKISLGSHGYDPIKVQDMRTIFFARGPAFKKGFKSGPIHMVDHYNLLCHLLNIEPLANNGTWSNVKDMLNTGTNLSPTLYFFQSFALFFTMIHLGNSQ